MTDPKQLPYLLRLLDDESPFVRETVLAELDAFGPSLEDELARLAIPPSADQQRVIRGLLENHNRAWLKEAWPGWFSLHDDKKKLESGLSLLAEFQLGRHYPVRLATLLTQLAQEFNARHGSGGARELSGFLFQTKGLSGNRSDYYNPMNSNLVYVIEQKHGIPISLACVYILIGHRLGLDIEGCNVPGHFLARAYLSGRKVVVDCFNGGMFLNESDLTRLNNTVPVTMDDITSLECGATTIIARVLRNLVNAYHLASDEANKKLMAELLHMLEGVEKDSPE